MTSVYRDRHLSAEELRASIFRGELCLFSARPATLALCRLLEGMLVETFPEAPPRQAQFFLSGEEFFRRVRALRVALVTSAPVREAIREVLLSFGFEAATTYVDSLRLRAVPSGGHKNPAAAPAYAVHRDTWYANPPCQLNWWIPVYDVAPGQSFAIYPDYWARGIANSSHLFDYDEWTRQGGWQSYGGAEKGGAQHHPSPTEEPDRTRAYIVSCRRGESFVFSGAHLHATLPNDSGETRYSVDFRVVCLPDLVEGRGALPLDNFSRGSTIRDFLCLKDFSPFPAGYFSRC